MSDRDRTHNCYKCARAIQCIGDTQCDCPLAVKKHWPNIPFDFVYCSMDCLDPVTYGLWCRKSLESPTTNPMDFKVGKKRPQGTRKSSRIRALREARGVQQ